MAPHSSTLAWKIPWTEEPGRLQSMGLRRVGHDWATSLSRFTFMHWRRKRQHTPVFLPGESQGRGEPGGLPSMGSHKVGHDWSDLAAAAAAVHQWKKETKISFNTVIHYFRYLAFTQIILLWSEKKGAKGEGWYRGVTLQCSERVSKKKYIFFFNILVSESVSVTHTLE